MSDEAVAELRKKLEESESARKKIQEQAKSYVAKLNRDHQAEKEKLVAQLQESTTELANLQKLQDSQNVTASVADSGSTGEDSARIAQLEEENRSLQNSLATAKDQAKAYVKSLVQKHTAELDKLKAELQDVSARKHDEAAGDGSGDSHAGIAGRENAAAEEIHKLRSSLDTITEQSKAYVKKLVAKHREELDKNKVHLTELQEEVDNLKANAEAHTLEVNAKDYRLREVEERLTAALQGERDAKELLEAQQQQQQQISEETSSVQQLRDEVDQSRDALARLQAQFDALQEEMNALQRMKEASEQQSAESVQQSAQKLQDALEELERSKRSAAEVQAERGAAEVQADMFFLLRACECACASACAFACGVCVHCLRTNRDKT
jgi:predicted  nucleic acid-binding Zn-ribbon protein